MKTIKKLLITSFLTLMFAPFSGTFLQAETDSKDEPETMITEAESEEEGKKKIGFEWEFELDPYYTYVDLIGSLTDQPIPDAGEQSELEIYRDLFLSSYWPRFFILEASVYPLPCLGVVLKKNTQEFYEDAAFSGDVNLLKAITAGFEEPWAFSLVLGDVITFTKPGEKKRKEGNYGFLGYLASVGNYHIKDNELIRDDWLEVEWKIKGDREYEDQKLNWSFRLGGKFHDNPDITDVYYMGIRRSRLDYEASATSILKNSGIEYKMDVDSETFEFVKHSFQVDKKWPFKEKKVALTVVLGLIWESNKKYKGSLREDEVDNFQIMIRPNIEF